MLTARIFEIMIANILFKFNTLNPVFVSRSADESHQEYYDANYLLTKSEEKMFER